MTGVDPPLVYARQGSPDPVLSVRSGQAIRVSFHSCMSLFVIVEDT